MTDIRPRIAFMGGMEECNNFIKEHDIDRKKIQCFGSPKALRGCDKLLIITGKNYQYNHPEHYLLQEFIDLGRGKRWDGTLQELTAFQYVDPQSERTKVLLEADKLITGDRNHTYGSPTENFANIAQMWNIQFKHMLKDDVEFEAKDVASAMISLKLARMIAGGSRDTWVDIAGYAGCGAECSTDEK